MTQTKPRGRKLLQLTTTENFCFQTGESQQNVP